MHTPTQPRPHVFYTSSFQYAQMEGGGLHFLHLKDDFRKDCSSWQLTQLDYFEPQTFAERGEDQGTGLGDLTRGAGVDPAVGCCLKTAGFCWVDSSARYETKNTRQL